VDYHRSEAGSFATVGHLSSNDLGAVQAVGKYLGGTEVGGASATVEFLYGYVGLDGRASKFFLISSFFDLER